MEPKERHSLQNEKRQQYTTPQATLVPRKRFVRYNSVLRRRGPLSNDRLLEKRVLKPNKASLATPDSIETLQWAQKFITKGRSLLKSVKNEDLQFQRELEQNEMRTKAHERYVAGLLQEVDTENSHVLEDGDRFADSQRYGTDTSFKNYDETINASLAFTDLAASDSYSEKSPEVPETYDTSGESDEVVSQEEEDDYDDDDDEDEDGYANNQPYGYEERQVSTGDNGPNGEDDVIEILSEEESSAERPLSTATQLGDERDEDSSDLPEDMDSDNVQEEFSEEDGRGIFHSDDENEDDELSESGVHSDEKASELDSEAENAVSVDASRKSQSEALNQIDSGFNDEKMELDNGEEHEEDSLFDGDDRADQDSGVFDSGNLPQVNQHGIPPAFDFAKNENEVDLVSSQEEGSWSSQESLHSEASGGLTGEEDTENSEDFDGEKLGRPQKIVEQVSLEAVEESEKDDENAWNYDPNLIKNRELPVGSEAAFEFDYTNIARDAFSQRDPADTANTNETILASPVIADSYNSAVHPESDNSHAAKTLGFENHQLAHAGDSEGNASENESGSVKSEAESSHILIERVHEEAEHQLPQDNLADDEKIDASTEEASQLNAGQSLQNQTEGQTLESLENVGAEYFAGFEGVDMQNPRQLVPEDTSFHFESNANKSVTTAIGDTTYYSCGDEAKPMSVLHDLDHAENKPAKGANGTKYNLVYSESLYSESEDGNTEDLAQGHSTDYISPFSSDPFSVKNIDAELKIVKELIGGLKTASRKKATDKVAESAENEAVQEPEVLLDASLKSEIPAILEDLSFSAQKRDSSEGTHEHTNAQRARDDTADSHDVKFSPGIGTGEISGEIFDHLTDIQTVHGVEAKKSKTEEVSSVEKAVIYAERECFTTRPSEESSKPRSRESSPPVEDQLKDIEDQDTILVEEILNERESYTTIYTEPDVSMVESEREQSNFAVSNIFETSSSGDADSASLDDLQSQSLKESLEAHNLRNSESDAPADDLHDNVPADALHIDAPAGLHGAVPSDSSHSAEFDITASTKIKEETPQRADDYKPPNSPKSVLSNNERSESLVVDEKVGIESEISEDNSEDALSFKTPRPQDSDKCLENSNYETSTTSGDGSLKRTREEDIEYSPRKKRSFFQNTLHSTADRLIRAKAVLIDMPGKVRRIKVVPERTSKLARNATAVGNYLAQKPLALATNLKATVEELTGRAEHRITTGLRNEIRALKAKTYNDRLLQSLEHFDSTIDDGEFSGTSDESSDESSDSDERSGRKGEVSAKNEEEDNGDDDDEKEDDDDEDNDDEDDEDDDVDVDDEKGISISSSSDQTDTSMSAGDLTDSTFRGFDDSFEGFGDEGESNASPAHSGQPEVSDQDLSKSSEPRSAGEPEEEILLGESAKEQQSEDASSPQHDEPRSEDDLRSTDSDESSIDPATIEVDMSINLMSTPDDSDYPLSESITSDTDSSSSSGPPPNALARRKIRKRVSKKGRKTRI
ncbi:LAFA_0B04302g1_1 [Lachancea sp. 'fantastica']|nr:LAFA_0B04302g1_1 [Lachancea sp. 'fantastica']